MNRAERQEAIWQFIQDNPGCTSIQVMNAVNGSKDRTDKDIAELREQGRVASRFESLPNIPGGRRWRHTARMAPLDRALIMSKLWTKEALGRAL